MNNEGVKISYGDIAVGAKENFVPQVNSEDVEPGEDLKLNISCMMEKNMVLIMILLMMMLN